MKIFVSAAEASSDTHAASLIRALKDLVPARMEGEPLHVFGVGGPRCEAEGMEITLPASEFLSMGLVEVMKKVPKLMTSLRHLEKVVAERKPDLAIVLDYPDFHFRLAERLKKNGTPVVCMIPPKVWAWRSSRIEQIRELYVHVLTILPFEKKMYADAGVQATYVGNPLLDQLPLGETREEVRGRHGIPGDQTVLLLMPGSRPAEVKYHLMPMLQAAHAIQRKLGRKLKIWIPLAPMEDLGAIDRHIRALPLSSELDWKLSRGDAWDAMIASDAGIVKSGTSSLEAAVLGLPHVVVYKGSPVSEWVFKTFVRYDRPVSLVNLIHDFEARKPTVVHELILERFSVENMVNEVLPLLQPGSAQVQKMRVAFVGVREQLAQAKGDLSSPSELAAEKIIEIVSQGRKS